MRLLALQLQKHAQAKLVEDSDTLDDWRLVLAATLRPWLSHEWCSPRVEVVDYRPCCGDGGLLLSPNCDHSKLRAVLDVVVRGALACFFCVACGTSVFVSWILQRSSPAGSEDPEGLGRQRLLHCGPWRGFEPHEGGWHVSFGPPGQGHRAGG